MLLWKLMRIDVPQGKFANVRESICTTTKRRVIRSPCWVDKIATCHFRKLYKMLKHRLRIMTSSSAGTISTGLQTARPILLLPERLAA
ncbi:MAG TPA: hypothetical protein VIF86_02280 [Methylobacter sp.]|jgi:hypothetical protein